MGSRRSTATAPYVGTDTSRAAAALIESSAPTLEARVIAFIENCSATCEEVEDALGLSHQSAGARIRGAVLHGMVRDSGIRRPLKSGRMGIVWERTSQQEPTPDSEVQRRRIFVERTQVEAWLDMVAPTHPLHAALSKLLAVSALALLVIHGL